MCKINVCRHQIVKEQGPQNFPHAQAAESKRLEMVTPFSNEVVVT